MIFNSLVFFIFITIFFAGWHFFKTDTRLRLFYILAASTVFYGWWDWRFLFLIYFTGSVDYFLSLLMFRSQSQRLRKILLAISLISGLGVLTIFKYSKFFADIISAVLNSCGLDVDLSRHIPEFCLILPVGISFYTFQSLSYTIDIYRKRLTPALSWVHYLAYLMLFPQLVAGPIVRAVDLLPKLLIEPRTSPSLRYSALKLIVLGFFKKCVLADNAAGVVDMAFANVHLHGGTLLWWGVMILFAIQIYCDFSGYSDIARGIAKMMGWRFDLNFNHPYFACGIQDFWRRWHISLSSWFRDYVYIPLGGSRHGRVRTNLNLGLTFLLSGLWHGASFNFVIWGIYHALLLIAENIAGIGKRVPRVLMMGMTFVSVLVGWVFFRASNLAEAGHILANMFFWKRSVGTLELSGFFAIIAVFTVMELFTAVPYRQVPDRLRRGRWRHWVEPGLLAGLAAGCILFRGVGHGFIYFQF